MASSGPDPYEPVLAAISSAIGREAFEVVRAATEPVEEADGDSGCRGDRVSGVLRLVAADASGRTAVISARSPLGGRYDLMIKNPLGRGGWGPGERRFDGVGLGQLTTLIAITFTQS